MRFLEDGYDGTTVAKIREDAGVSNGALFHHFKSKDAIAAALYVDAIKDFQAGHWRILEDPPATLREGVAAMIAHHLRWVQEHPDQARFLYEAGQLDADDVGAAELGRLNGEIAAAYAEWYRPLIERGEARRVRVGLVVAIVGGPSHAVARHWLGGPRETDLSRHADELSYAAWASLAGPAALAEATGQAAPPPPADAPRPARVRIELLADDGTVLGTTDSELT
ncbi:MAG: TetR/AcrR family transcriptional regulator [Solirubrobacteraceae bacterium]|nr:TetR/AcrR family transcriptional regulator [Solirubrobacteraceae bacterium]